MKNKLLLALSFSTLSSLAFAQEPERKLAPLEANQMQELTVSCLPGENCAVLYSPHTKSDDARLFCQAKINGKAASSHVVGSCVFAEKNSTKKPIAITLLVENNNKNYVVGEFWIVKD